MLSYGLNVQIVDQLTLNFFAGHEEAEEDKAHDGRARDRNPVQEVNNLEGLKRR